MRRPGGSLPGERTGTEGAVLGGCAPSAEVASSPVERAAEPTRPTEKASGAETLGTSHPLFDGETWVSILMFP